eukprot:TRINITY_DN70481_c0_g1_i1.p1 TRINITY_DN70481_c0_g1~~TRINITY_DN70481_c0_g1_i1.p1  ORF type:complete len:122 (-),score=1.88 TRINITY_DN70481_c0_g1_i1:59-424(-)
MILQPVTCDKQLAPADKRVTNAYWLVSSGKRLDHKCLVSANSGRVTWTSAADGEIAETQKCVARVNVKKMEPINSFSVKRPAFDGEPSHSASSAVACGQSNVAITRETQMCPAPHRRNASF